MRSAVILLVAGIIAATLVAGLPTCGSSCQYNGDCLLSHDGCTVCRDSKCTPQCGATCTTDTDCGLNPVPGVMASNLTCPICFFNQCGSQYCGAPCTADSQCAANPFCKVCVSGGCSPPPTPKPSVPPTPAPRTPAPTAPKNLTHAYGSIYCGGSNTSCGDASWFSYARSISEAETIGYETCPTGNGDPVLLAIFTEPLACVALVMAGDFTPFYVAATSLGSAATQAISQCRESHSTCFMSLNVCARLPPTGARWGALATAGSPEQESGVTLNINNGLGYDTWEQADTAVMNNCTNSTGGSCGLSAVFFNCMGFAANSDGAGSVNFANSLSGATSQALTSCQFESEGEGGCTLQSAACISPYHESDDHTATGQITIRGRKGRRANKRN